MDTWQSDFRAWLEGSDVKNTNLYAYGKLVLDGTDEEDKSCRDEILRRSAAGERGIPLWELICKLRKAISATPLERRKGTDIAPEVVNGKPAWDLLPSLSPFSQKSYPMGYLYLITQFKLPVNGHHTFSVADPIHARDPEIVRNNGIEWRFTHEADYFTYTAWKHLEFAVQTEDLNLCILYYFFNAPDFDLAGFQAYLLAQLRIELLSKGEEDSEPNATARRLWYWFEFLTTKHLDIPDHPLSSTEQPLLLDTFTYYTSTPTSVPRFGLQVNHLGCREYCPIVRKALGAASSYALSEEYKIFLEEVPDSSLARVFSYLLTGDTQASFEIEREKPTENCVVQVNQAVTDVMSRENFTLNKDELCKLNAVFRGVESVEYRTFQNWIGVAYVPPKPEDVNSLMEGFLKTVQILLADDQVDPVVAAVVVAIGLVDIHPFQDGNGRLHRTLIHYVLGKKFYVGSVIIPLSKQLLLQRTEYFSCLKAHHFSLIDTISYTMDYAGDKFVVHTPVTHPWYRFSEMTSVASFLRSVIATAIRKQLPEEVRFVEQYSVVLEDLCKTISGADPKVVKRALDKYLKVQGNYGFQDSKEFPMIPPGVLIEKGRALLDIQPL